MAEPEKEPLIHCDVVQNRFRDMESYLDKTVRERILDRMPKEIIETVRQAKKNSWLPVKINVDITDYIAAEIGDEGVYKLSLESFNKLLNSSVVSPFFRSALNLVKIKPSTVLKLSPLFWKSIYRNCGEVSLVELQPTRVRVVFSDLPTFLLKSRNSLMGIAGALHAVISFSGAKALVILENFSLETKQANYIVSWSSNLMKK